jgi:hypothetical protein
MANEVPSHEAVKFHRIETVRVNIPVGLNAVYIIYENLLYEWLKMSTVECRKQSNIDSQIFSVIITSRCP